jgi:hypothetical protein
MHYVRESQTRKFTENRDYKQESVIFHMLFGKRGII